MKGPNSGLQRGLDGKIKDKFSDVLCEVTEDLIGMRSKDTEKRQMKTSEKLENVNAGISMERGDLGQN
jgi:hypothetical protein